MDQTRRRFLIGGTASIGGVGAVAAAVPFVENLLPSEKAKALGAPVSVDITRLGPGARRSTSNGGASRYGSCTVRRGMLALLPKLDDRLVDPHSNVPHQPKYAQNEVRSIKPEIFVAIGMLFAVLLTTAMFLWTLQRVLMGTPTEGGSARKLDRLEIGTLVPLAALILVLGLVPGPLVLIIQTALTRGPLAALARR